MTAMAMGMEGHDLSSLRLRYNPRAKSSHRHILAEYGLRDERKRKKSQSRPKSPVHVDRDDDGRAAKQKQKDEKNLQVLKDLDILKKHYYNRYMDLLRNRIQNQEEKLKEREGKMLERLKKESMSQPKRKLVRHVLINDKDYLDKLPKSHFYEIIKEEAQQIQSGKLKNASELEEFWVQQLLKAAMKRMARKYNISDISVLTESSAAELDESPDRPVRFSLSNIVEEEEGMPQTTLKKTPSRRTMFQRGTGAKKTKDIDDILFPKVKMPELHCFTMDVGPQEEKPVLSAAELERAARDKERWLFRKRLQKMYQLAMTNTAAAKRILSNHDEEDVEQMMSSADVNELINLNNFITDRDLQRYSALSSALVPYKEQGQGRTESGQGRTESGQGHTESGQGRAESGQGQLESGQGQHSSGSVTDASDLLESEVRRGSSKSSQTRSKTSAKSGAMSAGSVRSERITSPLAPLAMVDILPESKIMEAKCLSTLWVNYTNKTE